MNYFPTALMTTLLATAMLAGCGDDGGSAERAPRGETRTATESPHARLVIGTDSGAHVLDAENLRSLEGFHLDSRPKLITAGDDRHVFALQYDAGKVGVIDAGSWSTAHGDHHHSYVVDPALRETSFDHGTSYHAVSDEERSVIWYDDDGSFVAFDWAELADDEVDTTRLETGSPHHGVAAPTADGGFIASIAEGEHATGVAILDEKGKEQERIESCPGMHGETHVRGDGYAFGCENGMLVVAEGSGVNIGSPVKGAGSGTLVGDHASDIVVGDLYSEKNSDAATRLALYDVSAQKARAVDLGVEYSSFGRFDGKTVAMGTDGALHVIDESTGKISDRNKVVEAWETSENWEDPKPQVAVASGLAYVTDPRDRSIAVYEIGSGEERARATLEEVPTSLVVTNASRH